VRVAIYHLFKGGALRAKTVDVKSSTGRILCCTVFKPGGKKLLAKGHVISDEDIRVLESEGMENVWVTELEEGEVSEDDAVCTVATGRWGVGAMRSGWRPVGERTWWLRKTAACLWTTSCSSN